MYTRSHLVVSIVVGLLVGAVTPVPSVAGVPSIAVAVGLAAVAGTAIDLDHFLVARLKTGSWRALRRGLADPRRVLFRQSELFETGEVGVFHRLLSHALLGGFAVAVTRLVAPGVLLVVGASIYAHVVSDLCFDIRNVDRVVVDESDDSFVTRLR